MGVFSTRPEDQNAAWAAIPGDPLDRDDPARTLAEDTGPDPLGVGLDIDVSSVSLDLSTLTASTLAPESGSASATGITDDGDAD